MKPRNSPETAIIYVIGGVIAIAVVAASVAAFESVSDDTFENVLGGMHTLTMTAPSTCCRYPCP